MSWGNSRPHGAAGISTPGFAPGRVDPLGLWRYGGGVRRGRQGPISVRAVERGDITDGLASGHVAGHHTVDVGGAQSREVTGWSTQRRVARPDAGLTRPKTTSRASPEPGRHPAGEAGCARTATVTKARPTTTARRRWDRVSAPATGPAPRLQRPGRVRGPRAGSQSRRRAHPARPTWGAPISAPSRGGRPQGGARQPSPRAAGRCCSHRPGLRRWR